MFTYLLIYHLFTWSINFLSVTQLLNKLSLAQGNRLILGGSSSLLLDIQANIISSSMEDFFSHLHDNLKPLSTQVQFLIRLLYFIVLYHVFFLLDNFDLYFVTTLFPW